MAEESAKAKKVKEDKKGEESVNGMDLKAIYGQTGLRVCDFVQLARAPPILCIVSHRCFPETMISDLGRVDAFATPPIALGKNNRL